MKTVISFSLVVGMASGVFAQGVPYGPQFQVNTYTTNIQEYPAVACDADGNFVIVWLNPQGNPPFIFGQRYLADGTAIGSEFQVNTAAIDELEDIEIAMAADGRFVVVWAATGGLDGSGDSVQGQRFLADATPYGVEMRMNATTFGNQTDPSVAMRDDGSFLVVWMGYGFLDENGIYGQAFSWEGLSVWGEFNVHSTAAAGGDSGPDVALDATGDFVATWEAYDSTIADQLERNIKARCFTWGGASLGPQFQVNTELNGDQMRAAVAIAPDGRSLILFQDDAFGIRGQHLAADCTTVGENFEVNSPFVLAGFPDVVADDLGRFVAAWYQNSQPHGRIIPDTAALTTETFVIPSHVFTTYHLKIGGVSDGRFVAAWRSYGSVGNDPNYSVQARRFAGINGIFIDGFETGDTTVWDGP